MNRSSLPRDSLLPIEAAGQTVIAEATYGIPISRLVAFTQTLTEMAANLMNATRAEAENVNDDR